MKMKSIVISTFGGPEVLKQRDTSVPVVLGEGQILVKVMAFGVNRPDIIQRKGHYPAPEGVPADIPGLEIAGVVEKCGPNASRWQIGERVCGLLAGGGYSEYALVHEDHCLPLGEHLSFEEGAAIPETLFTVWHNVFQRGQLERGQRLLVHGGSGGIGTMAIQLARWAGATVFATAGSDDRCRRCEELGADRCFNYKKEDFAEQIEGRSLDVILDSIGGEYFEKNLSLLRDDGKLVQINSTGGRKVELDLLKLMQRRFHLTGSTLRPRDATFKSELRQEIESRVWQAFLNQDIRPVIHGIYSAKDIVQAHRDLENGEVFGKIVLTWA